MLKVTQPDGQVKYIPSERVTIIQRNADDELVMRYMKGDGTQGGMKISDFMILKTGTKYS